MEDDIFDIALTVRAGEQVRKARLKRTNLENASSDCLRALNNASILLTRVVAHVIKIITIKERDFSTLAMLSR
jgi:hypothetical protein